MIAHPRLWLAAGGLFGAVGVVMAAGVSHALAGRLDGRALASVDSAVRIEMWHALALLATGLLGLAGGGRLTDWAGAAFCSGTLLFCGSIYLHRLGGVPLAAVAPAGGLTLIAGWLLLAAAAIRLG